MSAPIVDYRFGDKPSVLSFVQCDEPEIIEVAGKLDAPGDKFVDNVAAFMRDEFKYPLDSGGNPSVDGQLLRYRVSLLGGYHFKDCRYYVWSFPLESLVSKLGYCAETANLGASILRVKRPKADKVNAWVCLGEVRTVEPDELQGYHAWVRYLKPESNIPTLAEFTIHTDRFINQFSLNDVYNKESEWAKVRNLWYRELAGYTEDSYIEEPGGENILTLMAYPFTYVRVYGLDAIPNINKKKMAKEFRKLEIRKQEIIWRSVTGV